MVHVLNLKILTVSLLAYGHFKNGFSGARTDAIIFPQRSRGRKRTTPALFQPLFDCDNLSVRRGTILKFRHDRSNPVQAAPNDILPHTGAGHRTDQPRRFSSHPQATDRLNARDMRAAGLPGRSKQNPSQTGNNVPSFSGVPSVKRYSARKSGQPSFFR